MEMIITNPIMMQVASNVKHTLFFKATKTKCCSVKFIPSSVTTAEYSTDGKVWQNADNVTVTLQNGELVMYKGKKNGKQTIEDYSHFEMTGIIEAGGSIDSLWGMDDYAYYRMFAGCSSLTKAPELPSKYASESCYYGMFIGCTYLTEAPKLPATMLNAACYCEMFQGCMRLLTAPKLPAIQVLTASYSRMFQGCTNLTSAELGEITDISSHGCDSMFDGCGKLLTIKYMGLVAPDEQVSPNWVAGLPAEGGTFIKNAAATWSNVFGPNSIPTRFTVETTTT